MRQKLTNIDKLSKLGWEAPSSLSEGLSRTIRHYRKDVVNEYKLASSTWGDEELFAINKVIEKGFIVCQISFFNMKVNLQNFLALSIV